MTQKALSGPFCYFSYLILVESELTRLIRAGSLLGIGFYETDCVGEFIFSSSEERLVSTSGVCSSWSSRDEPISSEHESI
jgi:hypothetical protein